jgi:hypothetical protein
MKSKRKRQGNHRSGGYRYVQGKRAAGRRQPGMSGRCDVSPEGRRISHHDHQGLNSAQVFSKATTGGPKNRGGPSADRGILVFENTSEVIQAENALKKSGWKVRVMGPPPEIQTGCDLVIEFPLIEELNILRQLDNENICTRFSRAGCGPAA